MKNHRKSFFVTLLILIVILIIIGVVFFVYSSNNSSRLSSQVTSQPTQSERWMKMNTYKDMFGFSVSYPDTWSVLEQSDGSVSVFTNSPSVGEFKITKVSGQKVADSTGKWGIFEMYYDNENKQWIVTRSNERDGGTYDTPISVTRRTLGGLPLFNGGVLSHGWGQYDYIIPLSTDKFIIVRGNDEGGSVSEADSLLFNFVNTVTSTP